MNPYNAKHTTDKPDTSAMISTLRAFKEHPASVGQSYGQHFKFSASVAITLLCASFTALVHALAPPVFESTTS